MLHKQLMISTITLSLRNVFMLCVVLSVWDCAYVQSCTPCSRRWMVASLFLFPGSSCGSAVLHRSQCHRVRDRLMFQTRGHPRLRDSPARQKRWLCAGGQKVRFVCVVLDLSLYWSNPSGAFCKHSTCKCLELAWFEGVVTRCTCQLMW